MLSFDTGQLILRHPALRRVSHKCPPYRCLQVRLQRHHLNRVVLHRYPLSHQVYHPRNRQFQFSQPQLQQTCLQFNPQLVLSLLKSHLCLPCHRPCHRFSLRANQAHSPVRIPVYPPCLRANPVLFLLSHPPFPPCRHFNPQSVSCLPLQDTQ